MSEAEIQYEVPQASRDLGDLEVILNAIGTFQHHIPFPDSQDYQAMPSDLDSGSALIRLIRMTREPQSAPRLHSEAEIMRAGVEKHFPEADRLRLAGHFVAIVIRDAIVSE